MAERVLFDTSVLVPAMTEKHRWHAPAASWLERARAREIGFVVSAHSLAETYAVLTAMPASPRILPATAARLIRENIETVADVVSLSASDYSAAVRRLAELGVGGGAVYDALIARAAQKTRVDRLLTFNARDFLRVWPEGANVITTP